MFATLSRAASRAPAVDDKARHFWSFRPVIRPAVPHPKNAAWVGNPIDAFILARLEQKGFSPAAPADRITLIRRATYDLTGLPPTPAEVDAFIADQAPDAYEKLVDRLLASPRYGEKWGRHWLDLVRFAETNSYERDGRKPNAWRYRDYVIRSFNDDKPYDLFLKEQLAGDEMSDADSNADRLIATGFYRLGIWDDEPADPAQHRYDCLDDIVATVGQTMLGVTLDCARCHDHKIDPIPQADYYRLLAFFQNINDYHNGGATDERLIATTPSARTAYEIEARERQQQIKAVRSGIEEMERDFRQLLLGEPGRRGVNPVAVPKLILTEGERVLGKDRFERYQKYKAKYETLVNTPPKGEKALCVSETGPKPPDTFIMLRGSAHSPGEKVQPAFLSVITPGEPVIPTPLPGATSSGRRTVLANWIASPANPLTARVMVNRIWQYHFGRGIVRSSSNFGYQGDPPTHLELLDWLASEFVTPSPASGPTHGWSLKRIHRLIMTSSAYRMSSQANDKALATDPQNDLFWRFDMRRLTAEEIRDSILFANGTLNLKMFGPGVYPPIPRAVMQGQSRPGEGWEKSLPEESARRTIYVHAKRSLRLPVVESFDGAETDKTCPVRFVTVQPTQALGMLNGEFFNGEAEKLAARLKRDAGDDPASQVRLAFRLLTSRPASESDIRHGVDLMESLQSKDGATHEQTARYFCLVMLNLNEFVYLD